MERIEALRKRIGELKTQLRAMLDKAKAEKRAELNAEEQKAWDPLEAELRAARAELERELLLCEDDAKPEVRASKPPAGDRRGRPDPELDDGSARGRAPAGHTKPDREYSLIRAINALANRDFRAADVEMRASDEIAERVGKQPERGLFIPLRQLLPRALEAKVDRNKAAREGVELREITKAGSGANLVGVDLVPAEFIELLRNESVAVRAGARVIPNLDSDVDFPRQTGSTTGTWLATETTALTADTGFATSKLSLTPKTVGIKQEISRRMLKQSTPAVEDLVRDDIRQQIGLAVDLAAINGSGAAGQPRGIINTSGIGGVDALGGLTWADIVDFETDVASANALRGRLAYAARASVAAALKTTLKSSGIAGYLMADDGTINTYPFLRSEQVPAGHLVFGNWAELILALWGVLDLFPDPYTLGDRGGLVIRGFQDADVGLRHAASFSVAINVP